MTTRWLFGDQLGPHFVDDHRGPLLMVESTGVFRRRRFHRAKAHLVLSAMRHRAAELRRPADLRPGRDLRRGRARGGRARRGRGRAPDVVRRAGAGRAARPDRPAAARLRHRAGGLRALGRRSRRQAAADGGLLPSRPARPRRADRRRPSRPAGGGTSTTTTASRRRRAPRPSASPSRGGPPRTTSTPRCATTSTAGSATATSRPSVATARAASPPRGARRWPRSTTSSSTGCPTSAPTRTRSSRATDWMAHSLRQRADEPRPARPARGRRARGDGVPQRRGADRQRRGLRAAGRSAGATTSGTSTGTRATTTAGENALRATERMPQWFAELDAAATDARCLSHILDQVAEHGWVHHIPRLMVLGLVRPAARVGADAGHRLVPPRPSSTATTG